MLYDSTLVGEDRSANVSLYKGQDHTIHSNQKILFNSQIFEEKDNLNGTQNKRKTLFHGGDHSDLQQAPYKKQESVTYDIENDNQNDLYQKCQYQEQQNSEFIDFKNGTFSKEKTLIEQPTLLPKPSNSNIQDESIYELSSPGNKERRLRKQRQERQLEFIKILRNNVGFTNDIWRKRGFGVLQKAIFFSQRLMSVSITKKFRKMQRRQLDIINDKTSFYDIYRYSDSFDQDKPSLTERLYHKYQNWILNKKNLLINKLEDACLGKHLVNLFKLFDLEDLVIRPNSSFKIGWDIFIMIMVLINIFYVPLKIAFNFEITNTKPYQEFFLGDGAKAIFLIDIAMNFNTSFFKQGVLNNRRIDIIKRYGQCKYSIDNYFFWFDLIIVLPYFFGHKENWKFLEAIFILRAFLIRNIIQRLEEVFHPRNLGAALIDIIKVIFVVSFIAHLACCSFYFLTTVENASENWITKLNIERNDTVGLYVSGLYFAVITMITLGYGDIVPITTLERTFVIGMTLVSCAVFAYSVNTISGIIGDMSQRTKLFRQKMMNLNLHIQKRGLNKQLAMRVRKYIEYLYKEELISNESAEKDLEQIPLSLKEDVYQDIYGKLLRSNKVFNLNFTSFFLDKLALKMKEKRFGPEEIIYKLGDEGNTLYFLIKGTVQLFFPIKNPSDTDYLQISKLEKGQTFGFYSFFSGNNRETSARSMRVTSLVTLSFADFKEVAQKFPLDYEKFCMLRDQIKYSSMTKGLDVRCKSCDNYTHQLQDCPFIKYKPQKTILIAKYNKSDPMERNQQARRIIRSPNSLFMLQFISKDDIQYCLGIDNSDSDQEQYEQEQEEAMDLEEQFRDDKRQSVVNVEDKDLIDPSKFKEKERDREKDRESQNFIDTQQNKRQSSYHRLESSLSYKKKIMNSQHSNIGKQMSRLASRMSFRSVKQPAEKTQNLQIIEFMLVESDRVKSYSNYLPHNNIEKVLHQYNENLMMQKVYRPKKQIFQIINKDRQKINLSKLRVFAAMKKMNQNQQLVTIKPKKENSQRKRIIQEQLKQHSEGNSDYLSQCSPRSNQQIESNIDSLKKDKFIFDEGQPNEPVKYEIKVLLQTKTSELSEQRNGGQANENSNQSNHDKNGNIQIQVNDKNLETKQELENKDNEEKEVVKFNALKKKKTNSFILKPSHFYQENKQEELELSKNERQFKRKKSQQLLQNAIQEYNNQRQRRSLSNIIQCDKSSSPLQVQFDEENIKSILKKQTLKLE